MSLAITWAAIIASASHCVGFTLPGMMDEPGSLAGVFCSAKPSRGPHGSRRVSVGGLNKDTARAFRGGLHCTRPSGAPLTLSLFGAVPEGRPRRDERQAGKLGDLGRDLAIKAGLRVDTRADGRAAQRQPIHAAKCQVEPFEVIAEHADITGELLAQRQRRRVLEMCTPDLHNV